MKFLIMVKSNILLFIIDFLYACFGKKIKIYDV